MRAMLGAVLLVLTALVGVAAPAVGAAVSSDGEPVCIDEGELRTGCTGDPGSPTPR